MFQFVLQNRVYDQIKWNYPPFLPYQVIVPKIYAYSINPRIIPPELNLDLGYKLLKEANQTRPWEMASPVLWSKLERSSLNFSPILCFSFPVSTIPQWYYATLLLSMGTRSKLTNSRWAMQGHASTPEKASLVLHYFSGPKNSPLCLSPYLLISSILLVAIW